MSERKLYFFSTHPLINILNSQSLPLYALDTIIKKMALKNSAPFSTRNGREEKLSLCVAFMKADKGTLKMGNELSMLSSELTRNSPVMLRKTSSIVSEVAQELYEEIKKRLEQP